MAPVLEGKSINLNQKTLLKGELLIWRTKNRTMDQGTRQLKGFNLLHESKLVPRKLDPQPSSKVGLPNGVLLRDPFDSLCGEPQSAQLTSGAKCKHVGSKI
jgi:hypothetical protein